MNTKQTLNADVNFIQELFFTQIKSLTTKNLDSFDKFCSRGGSL